MQIDVNIHVDNINLWLIPILYIQFVLYSTVLHHKIFPHLNQTLDTWPRLLACISDFSTTYHIAAIIFRI